jgi:tetratricopeptide (TPR) repeat protein
MRSFCLLLSALAAHIACAQTFETRFQESLKNEDTVAQTRILKEWSTANSKDPELFIAYFNYYVKKSREEILSIDPQQKSKDAYALADSTGAPAGYLNSSMNFDSKTLQKGFDYANRAIELYPSRLDIRFGKIYMLGQAENFKEFTKTIIETIEYGNKIKYAWTWKQGKPVQDPKNFLFESMQDYIITIYNTEDDALLPYIRQISETVLKYMPNHVESLSNVALTWMIAGDFDRALPFLLKAETVNPKDVVVLNNIAESYKRKNDKGRAKSYYEKVIKYGSKEEADDARQEMKEL